MPYRRQLLDAPLTELPQRVAEKIDATGPCWLWTAARKGGYGRLTFEGKQPAAHRLVWEMLVGPVPEGTDLDHLCRVRHCVNPDHLEPVTHTVNVNRGAPGGVSRLNQDDVREIRRRYQGKQSKWDKTGPTQGELAREYGVSLAMINNILHGRSWERA